MIEVLQLLHAMEQGSARYSSSYYCRHLDKHEEIPQFDHGILESPLAQRDWIWLAYSSKDDAPLAILSACPMHNVAMLLRAYAIPSAPKSVFVGLLRKSLADISSRGYTKYGVFLGKSNKFGKKLIRLVKRTGGEIIDDSFVLAMGPSDVSKW